MPGAALSTPQQARKAPQVTCDLILTYTGQLSNKTTAEKKIPNSMGKTYSESIDTETQKMNCFVNIFISLNVKSASLVNCASFLVCTTTNCPTKHHRYRESKYLPVNVNGKSQGVECRRAWRKSSSAGNGGNDGRGSSSSVNNGGNDQEVGVNKKHDDVDESTQEGFGGEGGASRGGGGGGDSKKKRETEGGGGGTSAPSLWISEAEGSLWVSFEWV